MTDHNEREARSDRAIRVRDAVADRIRWWYTAAQTPEALVEEMAPIWEAEFSQIEASRPSPATVEAVDYPTREAIEEEMFKHSPVLSMRDGSRAGCSCMDRVFINGHESWEQHMTDVAINVVMPLCAPVVTEEMVDGPRSARELPEGTVFVGYYYPRNYDLPPSTPKLAHVQLTRGRSIVHGERMEYRLDQLWERIEVLYRPAALTPEAGQ